MMEIMPYFLAGVAGGVMGGMGLGGGTLLIPLLTLALHVDGRVAAWLNLLTFLPMSVVALFVHTRKGLISWHDVCLFVPMAFVSAAVSSCFAPSISSAFLRKIYGCFLIAVGVVSVGVSLVRSVQKKKKLHSDNSYTTSHILHK